MTALEPSSSPAASSRAIGRRLSRDGVFVLRGSFWMLVGRLSFGAAVVLQNVVLARLLGPAEFGAVLLAQSLLLPAALIAVGGLDLLAIRELRAPRFSSAEAAAAPPASERAAPVSFLAKSAVLVTLVALAVFAALAGGLRLACGGVLAALSCQTAAEIEPLLLPLIFLSAMQLLAAGMLRALGHVVAAAFLASVLAVYAFLCVTALALLAGHHLPGAWLGVQGVLAVQALGLAAGVGFSLRAVILSEGARSGRAAALTHLARAGPSLMLTQLLALLVSQSDVLVAGVGGTPESVAQYGVAARLSQLVSLPHLVLGGVLPPLMASALADGGHRRLEAIVRLCVTLAAAPALLLGIAFALVGRDFLGLAFGPFYAEAAPVLVILAAGNVVNVLCGPCSHALILAGREGMLNRITAASCVFCIGGGALASLWFGNIGLAVVYAVGLSLQGFAGAGAALALVGIRTHAAGPVGFVRAAREI